MIIAGVDYSMTSPAICVHRGDYWDFENCQFYFMSTKKTVCKKHMEGRILGSFLDKSVSNDQRYENISYWAMTHLLMLDHVSIEGYAFAAKGRVFDVAENTGVLKHKLFSTNTKYSVCSPPVIKKYASGSGSSDKDAMYECWKEDTGVDLMSLLSPKQKRVGNPVSDIVDSYFIAKKCFHDCVVESTYKQ